MFTVADGGRPATPAGGDPAGDRAGREGDARAAASASSRACRRVRRLAAEAGDWPERAEDWQWCARFAYQVIERRGTGGGNFRLMYSRFLEEAGTPRRRRWRAEAAARWTELAEAFHAASESDEPEPALWAAVDAAAQRVAEAEERLWTSLA